MLNIFMYDAHENETVNNFIKYIDYKLYNKLHLSEFYIKKYLFNKKPQLAKFIYILNQIGLNPME
jgi:hypothetical protein